jgi:hypothetical protein
LQNYKSSGKNQVSGELIQTGCKIVWFEIRKLLSLISAYQRKDSTGAPFYKKGDKTDCFNYRGMYLLSA